MKLSDVFWKAANEHLWDGVDFLSDRCSACCAAVNAATNSDALRNLANQFMRDCGVDTGVFCFEEFEYGAHSQGARYLTLMFFALVAEEEGL